MYKIAILGCENSHANVFLKHIRDTKYKDLVEVVGVFSEDREASEKLRDEFGIGVADRCDDFVGKVDAIVITARHGDNHYKYAKPYLASGIPMLIDKPVTCTEEDAKAFARDLKAHGVRVCGGSSCVFSDSVQQLKKAVAEQRYGKVYGGFFRAPIVLDSPHGGFLFYAQHLAQIVMEIFGNYPDSVTAHRVGDVVNCTVRYENDIEVNLNYTDGQWSYYCGINCADGFFGVEYKSDGNFARLFAQLYSLLEDGEQTQSYEDFFAPVYLINALDRALKSGEREYLNRP